jgi:spore protease
VDALASRRMARVCTTVQLTDTGITPGSGVGNHRVGFDRSSLGVPVIALGVPTVVDAATLALDLLEESGYSGVDADTLASNSHGMIVTPRQIDTLVARMARILGCSISLALQPGWTLADVELYLG